MCRSVKEFSTFDKFTTEDNVWLHDGLLYVIGKYL